MNVFAMTYALHKTSTNMECNDVLGDDRDPPSNQTNVRCETVMAVDCNE